MANRFAHVSWQETIAAPPDVVSRQFSDLDHHIRADVHPKLKFEVLERGERRMRFAQVVRLLGIRQRDVFERVIGDDGSIDDRAVEGPNRGGSIRFRFVPAGNATQVNVDISLPVPRGLGWLTPVLTAQVRREVRQAAAQDKVDIERGAWSRRVR